MRVSFLLLAPLSIYLSLACSLSSTFAQVPQEPPGKQEPQGKGDDTWKSPAELRALVTQTFEAPKDSKALHPRDRIWINRDEQAVILDGYVVQRKVPLELFACPTGTKEHESVVAVFSRAKLVHAALLAVNAQPGSPASFEPFQPAHGTTIRVYVLWYDDEGKPQGTAAQNWVRRSGSDKCMVWDWVFGGSKIHKDEEGNEHYLGDGGGELISVSNFTTSTMDVAVRSEQANANLIFEAFTEKIPKRDTPVRLVLTLTDEPPHGQDTAGDAEAEPPKFLTEKVPDNVMQFLAAKDSAEESDKPKQKVDKSKPVAANADKNKATTQKAQPAKGTADPKPPKKN